MRMSARENKRACGCDSTEKINGTKYKNVTTKKTDKGVIKNYKLTDCGKSK